MNRKTLAYILTVMHPGFGDFYMRSFVFGLFWASLYLAGHLGLIVSIGLLGVPIIGCFVLIWIFDILLLLFRKFPNERVPLKRALLHLLIGAALAVLSVVGFWAFFLKVLWQAY